MIAFGIHQESVNLLIPGVPSAVSSGFFAQYTADKTDAQARADALTYIDHLSDANIRTSLRNFMNKREQQRDQRKALMLKALNDLNITSKTRDMLNKMEQVRVADITGDQKKSKIRNLYIEGADEPETKTEMEKVGETLENLTILKV
ncbi:unnamed protein product, partial [Mesorhabditis belari]|uniref:Uncharacterized protein n=1 Tax=Mesorhabditis belari TaxID=2138241 RepID=A0AAF3F383_9BILA